MTSSAKLTYPADTGTGQPGPRQQGARAGTRAFSMLEALRHGHLEALARRSASHRGLIRQLLEHRIEIVAASCDRGAADAPPAANVPDPCALLASLSSRLARPGGPHGAGDLAPHDFDELKTVHRHRHTWSRLGIERRLAAALSPVPANAGPLNTTRLVNQTMARLRRISPGYLHHFLVHIDTLLWLDEARIPADHVRSGTGMARAERRPGPARRS